MTKFTTRVELLDNATDEDYKVLYETMAKSGFTKTIKYNGVTYNLPPAEYNKTGNFSINHVFNLVEEAAKKNFVF